MTRELDAMGTLARSDGAIVARYCETFVQWRLAMAALVEHGRTAEVVNKRGNAYIGPRPEVRMIATFATLLLRMEQELGLTPAARARIHVTTKPAEKPEGNARFFRGTG